MLRNKGINFTNEKYFFSMFFLKKRSKTLENYGCTNVPEFIRMGVWETFFILPADFLALFLRCFTVVWRAVWWTLFSAFTGPKDAPQSTRGTLAVISSKPNSGDILDLKNNSTLSFMSNSNCQRPTTHQMSVCLFSLSHDTFLCDIWN